MSVIRYHVPIGVPQGPSPICWLACAIMIMQYKRGSTSLQLSELGIEEGLDFRSSSVANPNNPEKGSNVLYAHRLRQLGFTLARLNPRPRGCAPGDAAYVQWLLREHGPLILNHFMGSFWYGPTRTWRGSTPGNVPKGFPKDPGIPHGAHAVVITGWDSGRGRVYFNNPWGDMDVPTTESSIIGAIRRWETPQRFPLAYLP